VNSIQRLGYPARTIVTLAAVLALAVHWFVQPLGKEWVWSCTVVILLLAALLVAYRTRQLSRAHRQSAHVLKALSAATADIPVSLRTRMPLVIVTGDALNALFDRHQDEKRLVYVGDGAIWLRADQVRQLPQLALAMRQWRDGQAPDGVVLSVAPALHDDVDALAQSLRISRQALADASRMVGVRMPGYVAVYQRLTRGKTAPLQWYGVSTSTPLVDAQRFEAMLRSAESDPAAAPLATSLSAIVGWTQRVIFGILTDPRQPATPWALYGAGWIDCGPASNADKPWEQDLRLKTHVMPADVTASPAPWPLPQPLIEAMPRRLRVSPRLAALGHAIAITALAAAAAFLGAGRHNAELLTRIDADITRYRDISADHDAARREALKTLVADRDELDRYARTGVPSRLSFGLYHGASVVPALNTAIASYKPPPPPPEVVTLDSMSLFDSGKTQLKPGSNRSLVEALEMIKAHPEKRILVAGYTDNAGNAASNLTLSVARAAALRDWLIDASGIAATQFAIQGYGDTRPIASNETPEGRARNRRVEITLVPDYAQ
jgi:outer membrane protein OmpA-like peptidoglycan-associated protein